MNPALEQACAVRGVTLTSLLYSSHASSVFKGQSTTSEIVAVKLLKDLSDENYARAYKECENQLKFSDLANVVAVRDSFGFKTENLWSFVIVMEFVEKTLQVEIDDRKANNHPWTEAELMTMSEEVIETLATMQDQGIAHRDVKPQNLFIDYSKKAKLGDFGSARILENAMAELTVVGTPFYMSPELRELLIANKFAGNYCPFKSDVYSLGLTLLHCYLLEPPMSLLRASSLEENTRGMLTMVRYPRFRQLLASMLAIAPQDRSDFIQLRLLMNPPPANVSKRPEFPGRSPEAEDICVVDTDEVELSNIDKAQNDVAPRYSSKKEADLFSDRVGDEDVTDVKLNRGLEEDHNSAPTHTHRRCCEWLTRCLSRKSP